MNKKLMGLLFVVITAGCHPTPEGAVCPPDDDPERYMAERKAAPGQELTEAQIEQAKRYLRETRRRTP